jgi:hypothetical protein
VSKKVKKYQERKKQSSDGEIFANHVCNNIMNVKELNDSIMKRQITIVKHDQKFELTFL